MVSNNVWVEATIHPDSAKELDLGWDGPAVPLSKLHITMAFTTFHAKDFDRPAFVELAERLESATSDLPTLLGDEEVEIHGSAILAPGKGDFGVLLVRSPLLWNYSAALTLDLTKDASLDTTYPGWLPHITMCENVTNVHDIGVLSGLARKVRDVKLDGLWLRAGRMCLPL